MNAAAAAQEPQDVWTSQEEEEGAALQAARQLFMPPYLSGPLDPARMELTPAERQRAVQLKQAIQGLPDLDNLSDFLCAQIAVVEEDPEKAVEKAYQLQAFKQEFDVRDTYEQARRVLDRALRQHPGYLLHYFLAEDRYCYALDLPRFNVRAFNSPVNFQEQMSCGFYLQHALHPDLAAVRSGAQLVVECQGYIWKAPEMMDLGVLRMLLQDTVGNYPLHLHKIRFCNTGVFINLLTSMVKRYIPKTLSQKFEMESSPSDVRLDTICLVPNPTEASDRVLRELMEAVRRRYQAEESFRL